MPSPSKDPSIGTPSPSPLNEQTPVILESEEEDVDFMSSQRDDGDGNVVVAPPPPDL